MKDFLEVVKSILFCLFIFMVIVIVFLNFVPVAICGAIWLLVNVIDEHINQRKDYYDE